MKKQIDRLIHQSSVLPLTKVLRQKLRSELKRTGLAATTLLKFDPTCPMGLKPGHLTRWIAGIIKEAPASHVDYVLARLRSLPNGAPDRKRNPHRRASAHPWLQITDQMAQELRAEFARTGHDYNSVVGLPGAPEGLRQRVVRSWYYREAQTAQEPFWTFVMEALKAEPDNAIPRPAAIRKPRKTPTKPL